VSVVADAQHQTAPLRFGIDMRQGWQQRNAFAAADDGYSTPSRRAWHLSASRFFPFAVLIDVAAGGRHMNMRRPVKRTTDGTEKPLSSPRLPAAYSRLPVARRQGSLRNQRLTPGRGHGESGHGR